MPYLVVGVIVELELVNEESPYTHWNLATFIFDMRQRDWDCFLDQVAHAMILAHPVQAWCSTLGKTFGR
ncbi:hypothetical protein KCU98_g88, partial [Aureobasidium melanogenum]